jgi:hypothetical protein
MFANSSQKRLKYEHFDSNASPVFLSPKKTSNQGRFLFSRGPNCVADCTGKASRWKQLLNAII